MRHFIVADIYTRVNNRLRSHWNVVAPIKKPEALSCASKDSWLETARTEAYDDKPISALEAALLKQNLLWREEMTTAAPNDAFVEQESRQIKN